jgi:hypothetical protein
MEAAEVGSIAWYDDPEHDCILLLLKRRAPNIGLFVLLDVAIHGNEYETLNEHHLNGVGANDLPDTSVVHDRLYDLMLSSPKYHHTGCVVIPAVLDIIRARAAQAIVE